jgi:hypothetical protein
MLNAMKRLIAFWRALCTLRHDELRWMQAMALGAFIALIAALATRSHYEGFADFCTGLAVAFSGILVLLLFSATSAESRAECDEAPPTELHLSR